MATVDSASHSLQVKRHVHASPTRVYRAWTDEAQLARWFAPSADFETVVHEMDVRSGGTYRIEMRHPDGSSHVAVGEYRELQAPTRLTFTWRWEGAPMADTLVTVEFLSKAGGTEVVLTHTLFQSEDQRDEHTKGWTGCLTRLEAVARAEG
jgi:uncharacterized protein YndB with AHSA1/START domain